MKQQFSEAPPETVWEMVVEKMAERIADKAIERMSSRFVEPQSILQPERIRIRGIRGLAAHLGIGLNKAQNLKNEGAIPYYEDGGLLFFYSDEIDTALRKGGV